MCRLTRPLRTAWILEQIHHIFFVTLIFVVASLLDRSCLSAPNALVRLSAADQMTVNWLVDDHGQFPWGKNSSSGILTDICQKLTISPSDNVGNCCLVIHLLLGAVAISALSTETIAATCTALLLKYLRYNLMRRDEGVVP